jgi:hypothetical protein
MILMYATLSNGLKGLLWKARVGEVDPVEWANRPEKQAALRKLDVVAISYEVIEA